MTISLTPQLEALVEEKVKSGRYASAGEVLSEALQLLEERDQAYEQKRAALLAEIEKGLNSPSVDGEQALQDIRDHMARFPNGRTAAR